MLVNAALAAACWIGILHTQHWPLWIRLGAATSLYGAGFILLTLVLPWDRVARGYLVQVTVKGIQQWRNRWL
jgi:hypothetical protein